MNTIMNVNIVALILIIIVYLGIIALLSYFGLKKSKSSSDFITGGRNISPFVMALSYGAAFISTSAIVGFAGVAANLGLSLIWLVAANILFGIFFAFALFGKQTRKIGLKLDAHTFGELLGRRVNSSFVQIFTGIIMFLSMPLYAAAVLIGAARIIESLLGIHYEYAVAAFSLLVAVYVLVGGLRGVMYTDALQGSLMILGMVILLFVTFKNLGGVVSAFSKLSSMSDMVPDSLKLMGHRGWTNSPKFNSPLWWIIFSSLVFGVGIGVLAQPHLAVRAMTVKSNKELNRAVLIGSIFILITVGTPYIVGSLSNVYFFEKSGKLAITIADGNVDSIIPIYIKEAMPVWFSYLFMLVILSASISTLSSQFHAIGIAIGRDIYETAIKRNRSSNITTLISRVGIIIAICVTVVLAMKLPPNIIARATAIFFGVMASGFLAPFMLSLYWKRLTKTGMLCGIFSGLVVVVFCFVFLHIKESSVIGISKIFFGKDALLSGVWQFIDPLVFALPVSFLFTFFVSLFTKVKNKSIVDKIFS